MASRGRGRPTPSRRRFLLSFLPASLAWFAALRSGPGRRASELLSKAAGAVEGGGAPTVDLICRRAWGAEPPSGEFDRHPVRRLTVHHSAVVLERNCEAPSHFRAHQEAHRARGWPDIAYHVLIDRRGNVYKGRPHWARGDTATNYDPAGHLGVLCEGNFQQQGVSDAQVAALVDVLAWACRHFGVSPRRIRGHRDYADTACPGDDLYRLIEGGQVRRRVRRRLRDGDVELTRLCGRAGRRKVRRIEAACA